MRAEDIGPAKIDQLTFTRFLAAIIVVVFHYGLDIFPFNSSWINFVFKHGDLFVSYFFVLSGFVMFVAYQDKKISFLPYLQRRIARIYPVHIVGLILLLGSYLLVNRIAPPLDILFQSTLLHAWVPRFAIMFNYPSWSLGAEMFFYAIFPFLLPIFKSSSLKNLVLIVVIVWLATMGLSVGLTLYFKSWKYTNNFVAYFPVIHLCEFLMGILFARYYSALKSRSISKWNLFFVSIVILMLIKIPFTELLNKNIFMAPFFGTAILLLSLHSSTTNLVKILRDKRMVMLGEISYAIYILQVPVFNLSHYLFKNIGLDNQALCFYLYICLLLLSSYGSYYIIEMPAKRFINNIKLRFS